MNRARQIQKRDYEEFDYIFGMDDSNMRFVHLINAFFVEFLLSSNYKTLFTLLE